MIQKVTIVFIPGNLFFSTNHLDILMLRNEYRIQGNLNQISFSFGFRSFLMLNFEEILIGIEFGFINLKKLLIKRENHTYFFLLKFFSNKFLKKKVAKTLEFNSNLIIRKWREENFVILNELTRKTRPVYSSEYKKNFSKQEIFSFRSKKEKIGLCDFIKKFRITAFIDYIIYRDLWARGFVIACGLKFGATYIIYGGSLEIFHACISIFSSKTFDSIFSIDFISLGRVGTSTKKRTLIGILSKNIFVNYFSIKWLNIVP